MPDTKASAFVEYLDKEMNIMGILSVFSVAVAGLTIDRTAAAGNGSQLGSIWWHSAPLLMSTAFLALLAAFLFYRERSLLAWYVGQLALAEATERPARFSQLLIDADAWSTWINYRLAFLSLYGAFLSLGLAVAREMIPSLEHVRQRWLVGGPFCVLIVLSFAVHYIFTKYRLEEASPWYVLWTKIHQPKKSAAA